MKNLHIKIAASKSKLMGVMLSAAGILMFGNDTSAQEMAEAPRYIDVNDIESVSRFKVNPDGSATLTLTDGRVIEIPADKVMSDERHLYIEYDTIEEAVGLVYDSASLPTGVLLGGVLVAAAGGALLLTGEGNVAPVFSSAQATSYAENGTGVVYNAVATDANSDPVTYSLSGTDAGLFTIDTSSGAVTFRSSPDFESPADAGADNDYQITITASDGTLSTTRDVTISVTNENDNTPGITSGAVVTASENETDTGYTVTAVDADGDTLTYTIVGGADASLFIIDGATGELSFVSGRDFETPSDANGDNEFEVTVQVSDGSNVDTKAVIIKLANDNDEAPVFTNGASVSVAENTTTTGYIAVATDADGDTPTFSISGGVDASLFTIDGATGVLSFVGAPDFEAPGDTGANNVYNLDITASDGTNSTVQSVAITVTNVNDNTPSFISGSSSSVAENNIGTGYVAVATDGDGDVLSYSISGGSDSSLFTINSTTGLLSFVGAPDFEAPSDANADNDYEVTIEVSDGVTTDTQAVTISVVNANDIAPVFTSTGSVSVAENSIATGYAAAANDVEGDPVEYFISGGADASLFTVNAVTGALSFISAPDFESPSDAGANNIYDVEVSATDSVNVTVQNVAVTVTGVNDTAPVFTSGASQSVNENLTATGYVAAATDADGDIPTYSISGGADAALFTVNSVTGALSFLNAPDFENPGDAGANNIYDVEITANDGVNSTAQSVAITVNDVVSEAPIFSSGATASIAENSTAVAYTAVAVDPNNNPVTYSLSGADAALFAIDVNTGEVRFIAGADFEVPGDTGANNTYDIIVSAFDGTDTSTQAVAIAVTNENDNTPSFTSAAAATAAENVTNTSYTATATDADGDTLGYSIVGGADAALFVIDGATGVLSFANAQDFENPGDANTDNQFEVTVQVSDGTNTSVQNVVVTVSNDNDETPVFISAAAVSVAENAIATGYVGAATDADGSTLSFSISGGADAALFAINANTGALAFNNAADFENPADANTDNIYDVEVTVSDGVNSAVQTVAVTVTNLNDNTPVFSSGSAISVAENNIGPGYVALASDGDGDTVSYSIVGGADAAIFTIDSSTGVLLFVSARDFENPADADTNNIYEVIIQASDGTNTDTQALNVTITNANDVAPVFISPTLVSVAENAISTGYTATATDVEGDILDYSIVGGDDAALFTINAATGVLSFINAPDFENPGDTGANNIYDIKVSVTDGVHQVIQSVAIGVTNSNDNTPIFTSATAQSMNENLTVTGYVATATDADGDTVTYSITGGNEAALFTIDSNTGALSFINPPDFENPGDGGGSNIYEVDVTASDGTNSVVQSVAVTVNDVLVEGPLFSSPATGNADENGTVTSVVAQATGVSPISYTITGGADAALFTIDVNTGVVSLLTAQDFESPNDAGANNVYDIIVTATDLGGSTSQAIAISMNNLNDNSPVFQSGATVTVNENPGPAFATVAASDLDGTPISYSITGGPDSALFAIDSVTGALSFIGGADFENPTDANTDGVYEVAVGASSGGATTGLYMLVTVTNVDEAPVFQVSSVSVGENQTITGVTAPAIDQDGDTITYSLNGGADAALFTIDANTGALSFIAAPDFETPADVGADNVYDVVVNASSTTNSTDQAIAVTVTDVNEAPFVPNNATFFTNLPEHLTPIFAGNLNLFIKDPDGDTLTFTITGPDAAAFAFNAFGELIFVAPLDFENPTDVGSDNTYNYTINASDGTLTTSISAGFTITDSNDIAPVFTSGNTANIAENTTVVSSNFLATIPAYQASATDGDVTSVLSYSISGGVDASLFTIDTSTGAVRFITSPDFENPQDNGGNNVYDIEVTVSDGAQAASQNVAITVDDISTLTWVGPNAGVIDENRTFNGSTGAFGVQAVNDSGAAVTYSIIGGPDAAFVNISNFFEGRLQMTGFRDFENPVDANTDNVYEVLVQATDGTTTITQTVFFTVENTDDESPVFSSGTTGSIAENATGVVYTATATDVDSPQANVVFFLQGGTDDALFNIDGVTGEVTFKNPPDFENPLDAGANNVYDILVLASDGIQGTLQNVQITVTDVSTAKAPAFTINIVSIEHIDLPEDFFLVGPDDLNGLEFTDDYVFDHAWGGSGYGFATLSISDHVAPITNIGAYVRADGVHQDNEVAQFGPDMTVPFQIVDLSVDAVVPNTVPSQTPLLEHQALPMLETVENGYDVFLANDVLENDKDIGFTPFLLSQVHDIA